jgi:competence protein ComEA
MKGHPPWRTISDMFRQEAIQQNLYNTLAAKMQDLIDSINTYFTRFFKTSGRVGRAWFKTPNQKEGKMQHFRPIGSVWVVVLMSLVAAAAVVAGDVDKININTATAEQLTALQGIGDSHAAGIIAYREKNGPFQTPEDLMKVPRIGQKTFERNKALITVQNSKKRRAKE